MSTRRKARYHRIDGWRGYWIPPGAIVGASDTGMWDDSPAPSDKVKAELQRFRKEVLRPAGIKSRVRFGTTANVFAGKRWMIVSAKDFDRAAQLAIDWTDKHIDDTNYIHNADLEELGYKPTGYKPKTETT